MKIEVACWTLKFCLYLKNSAWSPSCCSTDTSSGVSLSRLISKRFTHKKATVETNKSMNTSDKNPDHSAFGESRPARACEQTQSHGDSSERCKRQEFHDVSTLLFTVGQLVDLFLK